MNLFDMLEVEEPKEKAKKEKKNTEKKVNNVTKSEKGKKFKYPFEIYLAAEKRDVSHIFKEGSEYSEAEITKTMLEHGFYEFSGNVTYDLMEKDNVLVPIFQQHKKG